MTKLDMSWVHRLAMRLVHVKDYFCIAGYFCIAAMSRQCKLDSSKFVRCFSTCRYGTPEILPCRHLPASSNCAFFIHPYLKRHQPRSHDIIACKPFWNIIAIALFLPQLRFRLASSKQHKPTGKDKWLSQQHSLFSAYVLRHWLPSSLATLFATIKKEARQWKRKLQV